MAVIWTLQEKCKRCYSCIRECPAKAIKVEKGQATVIETRCLGCGHCVRVCSQHAKAVSSGIENTLSLIASHQTVAMVAPAFPASFVDIEPKQFVGALRQVGFYKVVEVAFGADLVNRAYQELLTGNGVLERSGLRKPLIASSCPAIASMIQKYMPELIPHLAPIVSPMVAMGRAVKKVYGADVKTVFIGPCSAKKIEFMDQEVRDAVDEVLTFTELEELWQSMAISPQSAVPSTFDPPRAFLGRLYPISGGFTRSAGLPFDIMDNDIILTEGKQRIEKLLDCIRNDEIDAELVDVLFCEGCINGPFMNHSKNYFTRKQTIARFAENERDNFDHEGWHEWLNKLADIPLKRRFRPASLSSLEPSEDDLRSILNRIRKYSLSDELNCGACGYDTCREYAAAVFRGLAEEEMCLPFLIERLQMIQNELKESLEKLAETQEQLIQHEKLASIGQLAAGVAHEVNNPLGSIMLYSHLVLQNLPEDDAKAQDVKFIMNEAKRCQKIVSGLLNFSRQGQLNLRKNNLTEIFDRLLGTVQKQPLFRHVVIETSHHDDIPEFFCDADQLYQVFLNLTINSAEAMPEGGRLTIGYELDRETQHVKITFSDTGVGIPQENLGKIFTPFFTTKQIGKGTGLGLAIAYGIIKMHRGSIQVKSQQGRGTTFTIDLPLILELTNNEVLIGL